ncbi:MAG: hypothetical protein IT323_18265 [Anaerolineae bacterium]|nr:hypothetical protein [Anaerolineae bacterium]
MNGSRRENHEPPTSERKAPGARRLRAEQTQRSARRALRDELAALHQLSLEVMHERGILPPLYGGAHLGPQSECRVIGLDRDGSGPGEPQRFLGLALQPANAEPNAELAIARDLLGYGGTGRTGPHFARSKVTLYAAWEALSPLYGSSDAMIEHVCQGRPVAVFPLLGADLKRLAAVWAGRAPIPCRGLVLCAESPALLEAAVWDYRLCIALDRECQIIAEEGAVPAETLPAMSVPDLIAYHDLLVVRAMRLYGSTSPLYAQQAQLDILRDDAGDLRAPLPLKPDVEPVKLLFNERLRRYAHDGTLLYLRAEGTPLATFWPQIRASRYFCIRSMYALIDSDDWRITGYRERPGLDWLLADDLDRLYRLVHLYSLHECLAVAGLIDGGKRPGDGFYDALAVSGPLAPWTGQEPDHEP